MRDDLSLISPPPQGGFDLALKILSYLEAESLMAAEAVSPEWAEVICRGRIWRRLTERRVRTDRLWRLLALRQDWLHLLSPSSRPLQPDSFYRRLYSSTTAVIKVSSQ